MSSGVRNLRAMFENQSASSSPEPRGRSPVESAAADSTARPTPTVRASFVSVEPSGGVASDLGMNKGTPTNSAAAHRRESFSISHDHAAEATELKRAVTEEREERKHSVAIVEAVPEQAVASRESSMPAPPFRSPPDGEMPNLGAIMKGSDFPDGAVEAEASPVSEAPAAVSEESPVVEEEKAEPTPAPVVDAPAVDAPAVDAPAVDTPEVDTPAVDTLAVDAPAADPPAVDTTADHTPAVDASTADTPAADTPAVEAPVVDAPVIDTPAETPADNPDKAVTGAQEEVSLKPADPTDATAIAGGKALPPPAEDLHASTPEVAESKPESNGAPAVKPKVDVKKPSPISTQKATSSKTAPLKSPLKSPVSKPAPKRPTTPKLTSAASAPKPKHSPTAKPAPKPAALKEHKAHKEPVKAPAHKTSRTSLRQSSAPTAASSTGGSSIRAKSATGAKSTTAAPAPENKKPAVAATKPATAPSATLHASKKPQAKPPTHPVRLPSHLTKPTAASAAKLGEEKPVRKPVVATRPSAPPKPAPVAKAPRASIAPSAAAPKRPESRVSSAPAPNEGFLARMMRPTTASASKTHEKPTSPPRKAASKTTIQKGKNKVIEVAAKAKAAITNGDDDEASKDSSAHDAATDSASVEGTESAPDHTTEASESEAAPSVEEAVSPTTEQTPSLEGTAVH
ncbi:hypothetical protein P153DRAFT_374127 [Dothidotthia symphoricarpi CBS 119687]|uniref:Uncharacterized protein n=1 Tax=Dothidotthia symphoricarpi CBS 119687 TaxID=1392245 RepID=A0A6A6AKN6_9PLEO|nr:uncharacterized protein P153DRAFT_374127 [Dothidotthia symphoricarpi CBS 119687]KAF2132380.1 hypothetical protein P153DRAFT_374127 [Dothidotthia symphoricarpi CBS 119687]